MKRILSRGGICKNPAPVFFHKFCCSEREFAGALRQFRKGGVERPTFSNPHSFVIFIQNIGVFIPRVPQKGDIGNGETAVFFRKRYGIPVGGGLKADTIRGCHNVLFRIIGE